MLPQSFVTDRHFEILAQLKLRTEVEKSINLLDYILFIISIIFYSITKEITF